MSCLFILLGMVPIFFGYFLGTLFFPFIFLAGVVVSLIGLVLTPFYILYRTWNPRKVKVEEVQIREIPIVGKGAACVGFSLFFPQFVNSMCIDRVLAPALIFGRRTVEERLARAQLMFSTSHRLRCNVDWVFDADNFSLSPI